nr:hypothetical protein [Tanacetum cinerariifolium]
GSITEFVYLVEAHHHLNPIFIPKDNSPRRLDDDVVMLVLEARGRPFEVWSAALAIVSQTFPIFVEEEVELDCSGVVGRSSLKGFHQPCVKFTVGIWALPMSSSSDNCGGSGGVTWDPEALGAPDVPDGPAGRGGGG